MWWRKKKAPKAQVVEPDIIDPGSDNHAYSRLVRTNKAQMALIWILLSYAAILTPSSIIAYKEGGKTEVITLTFDDTVNQYVNLTKGPLERATEKQLIINHLKQYVVWRELVDHTTTEERDRKLALFTERSWFAHYLAQMDPKKNNFSPRLTYRQSGMTRDVLDVTIAEAPNQANTYFARYTAVDRIGNAEVRRSRWLINIVAVRAPSLVPQTEAAENPISLKVYNYSPQELPNET